MKYLRYIEHKILGPNPLPIIDIRTGKPHLIRRDGYYEDLKYFMIPSEKIQEKILRTRKEYYPSEFLIWDER